MGDKKFSVRKLKKDQLLIAFLVGILLLVITWPSSDGEETESKERDVKGKEMQTETQEHYASEMEAQLEEILSQMKGAGEVSVMITLKSSAEKVVEKDTEAENETVTESDSQGGSRTTTNGSRGETTVYQGENSGEEGPYIRKEISPQVEGVLVIAQGGDSAVVKQNITEAVQALFGIDTHKIRIMKKN